MSDTDLEIGVSAAGIDQTVADIGRVKAATDTLEQSAERQRREAGARTAEEQRWAGAIAAAKEREAARVLAAAESERRALQQHQQAQQSAAAAATAHATQLISFGQRVAGAANAVQALTGQLGLESRTAGLIGAMTQAGAAGAQLGMALGPAGAVVGGIVGAAVPALQSLISNLNEVEVQTTRVTESLDEAVQSMEAMQRNAARQSRIGMGLGSSSEQQSAARLARERLESVRNAIGVANEQIGRSSGGRDTEALMGNLRTLSQQRVRLERELRAAESALQQFNADEAASVDYLQSQLEDDARQSLERPRRGSSRSRQQQQGRGRVAAGTIFFQDTDFAEDPTGLSDTGDESSLNRFLDEQAAASRRALEVEEQRQQKLRESAEAQNELNDAAKQAAEIFGTGYVDSIERVIETWNQANQAARRAGTGMISQGRLMERSLVAVGNNIAQTIGGHMKGAFEQALGAWMDGSASFVEAAESMAKGVIKALVMEGTIQALVEGARAIASAAGQDYVGAAAHAAAAGAWALVAGAAAGVGAATGSFGGGSKPDKSGSLDAAGARGMSDRSIREERDAGPTIVNVYPGILAPAREVAEHVYNALEVGARHGRTLPVAR